MVGRMGRFPSRSPRFSLLPRNKLAKMSSGYGSHGTEGRCYKFWMNFEECMVAMCVFA